MNNKPSTEQYTSDVYRSPEVNRCNGCATNDKDDLSNKEQE